MSVAGKEASSAAADERKRAGSSRRRAREVALQVLYAIDLASDRKPRPRAEEPERAAPHRKVPQPDPTPVPTSDEVFDAVSSNFEMPDGARSFARELVQHVRERAEALDGTIGKHARNWRVSRMAAVDRNILRLATYELQHTDTPGAVILNEAVDLARRFGDDPSPAFVNGILDAVARVVRESPS
jgi:N utilization substance protein B